MKMEASQGTCRWRRKEKDGNGKEDNKNRKNEKKVKKQCEGKGSE
jgi:hypothetical protein